MRTAGDPRGGAEATSQRLDSWKEIAAYFGKDIRTVRRWESDRGLPVHRVRGGERGSVFGYIAELEAWLREKDTDGDQTQVPPTASFDSAMRGTPAPEAIGEDAPEPPVAEVARRDAEAGVEARVHGRPSPRQAWTVGLIGAAAIVLTGVVVGRHLARGSRSEAVSVAAAGRAPDDATRDLYLRGRYVWNLRTEASLTQAVDLFTQAIVHDPNFEPAYAGLADSYLMLRQYGHMTDAEAYPRAYFASRRAVALDDSSGEAHRSYAFVLDHWLWNFPAAETEYRRAIALDPRDAESHHWYATSLLSAGRYADARKEIEVARQLQPESVAILANRGFILKFTDEPEALASLSELEQANPGFPSVHTYLSRIRFDRKQYDEFLSEARQAAVLLRNADEVAVIDKARGAFTGHGERAMLSTLAEGYGRLADHPRDPHATVASLYFAHLGDTERTLHYLTLSCGRRESNFQAVPHMPEYRFLNGNPQFEALMERSRTPFDPPPPNGDGVFSARAQ